ncbi:glycosyltransferase family 2 protein [Rothia nasimurium]|uniref:glycosyltransferase family 2 protein n=1 Tax=Rothia nasimurium TaxID=85336 RepID=UPI001F25F762|nr:glycosyltransferase family A protein [Rothia nasimurium]
MRSFSVVIPAYNAESYLQEQLEALLNNTVSIPEIIVSDNGSTDSTKGIVECYAQKYENIKYLYSGECRGVSYARNKAIRRVHSELILMCDADDVVSKDWAEKLIRALDTADLVGSGYGFYLFDEGMKQFTVTYHDCQQPKVFGDQPYCVASSMGVTKAVFEAIGGFDESYRGGHEEVDFCLRLSAAGFTQGWVSEPLISYRQRPSSRGIARQSRNYGRTWVQLTANFSPEFDHHLPSLKLMVRKVLPAAPKYFRQRDKSWLEVRGFWWNFGVLEGLVRYRLLGKLPSRCLVDGK